MAFRVGRHGLGWGLRLFGRSLPGCCDWGLLCQWWLWLLLLLFLLLLGLLLLLLLLLVLLLVLLPLLLVLLLLLLVLLLLLLVLLLLLLLVLFLRRWRTRRTLRRLLALRPLSLRPIRAPDPFYLQVRETSPGIVISMGRRDLGSNRIHGLRSRGILSTSDLGSGSRGRGLCRWDPPCRTWSSGCGMLGRRRRHQG